MNTTLNNLENMGSSNNQSGEVLPEKQLGKKDFSKKLDIFSFRFLLLVLILLPIFFIPGNILPFDYLKVLLGVSATTIGLLSIGYSMWSQKRFMVPNGVVSYSAIVFVVLGIVSAFMGPSVYKSLIGMGTETTTVLFAVTCLSLMLIASRSLNKPKRFEMFFGSLTIGLAITFIFQTLRLLVSADTLSLGVLVAKNSSLLGSWFDLSIISAFSVLLFAFLLQRESLVNKWVKVLIYVLYVLSIFFLIVTNAFSSWISVVGAGLIYLLFTMFVKKSLNTGGTEIASSGKNSWFNKKDIYIYIPLVISIVFIFVGSPVSNWVANKFSLNTNVLAINRVALSLPLMQTLTVGKSVISENPLFGVAPNRFVYAHGKYKPLEINQTDFWQVDFTSAFGYIATVVIEYGTLAGLSFVVFIVSVLLLAFKMLKVGVRSNSLPSMKYGSEQGQMSNEVLSNSIDKQTILSLSIVSISMLIVLAVFMPAQAPMLIIFTFLGALIAGSKLAGLINYKYVESPKIARILSIVLILITVLYFGLYIRKTIASFYFQRAVTHTTDKTMDLKLAERYLLNATKIEPYDNYYQALAQVLLADARFKIQSATTTDTATVELVRKNIEGSIESASNAIMYDKSNYFNYVILARISSALVPLNVPNAFDFAVNSYSSAIMNNPTKPDLLLETAKFFADAGKFGEAKLALEKALSIKSNYQEAIFLLSQVQATEGSIDDAISSVTLLTKNNPQAQYLFFQLGYLKYVKKDYLGAIDALNNAIKIDAEYANARYFLGLSLSKLGKVNEAIEQFVIIQKSNPDNKEIVSILENLRAGRPPFSGTAEPSTSLKTNTKTGGVKSLNK